MKKKNLVILLLFVAIIGLLVVCNPVIADAASGPKTSIRFYYGTNFNVPSNKLIFDDIILNNQSHSLTDGKRVYYDVYRRINGGSWTNVASTSVFNTKGTVNPSGYVDNSLVVNAKTKTVEYRARAYYYVNGTKVYGDYSNVIKCSLTWKRTWFWEKYKLDLFIQSPSCTYQRLGIQTNVK